MFVCCVFASIKVNDQIVEVDGISLVGVTQLFAATVLKNTRGLVKYEHVHEHDGAQKYIISQSFTVQEFKGEVHLSSGYELKSIIQQRLFSVIA